MSARRMSILAVVVLVGGTLTLVCVGLIAGLLRVIGMETCTPHTGCGPSLVAWVAAVGICLLWWRQIGVWIRRRNGSS